MIKFSVMGLNHDSPYNKGIRAECKRMVRTELHLSCFFPMPRYDLLSPITIVLVACWLLIEKWKKVFFSSPSQKKLVNNFVTPLKPAPYILPGPPLIYKHSLRPHGMKMSKIAYLTIKAERDMALSMHQWESDQGSSPVRSSSAVTNMRQVPTYLPIYSM